MAISAFLKHVGPMVAASFCAFVSSAAYSDEFPARPIRVIVPFAAGGGVDATARLLANEIQATNKVQVIVDNRPGGATFIGMQACAKAPADGHTVCMSTADSLSFNPWLYTKIPYDPEHDFAGVSELLVTSTVIYTHSNSRWKTFAEVVSQGKSASNPITFGTFGPGSAPDLIARHLSNELKLNVTTIPYKGASQILQDALSGQIDLGYHGPSFVLPLIKEGKLRALAVTGTKPNPFVPNAPTLREFGADPNIVSYFGLYAPAKTPPAVIQRLYELFTGPLRTAGGKKFLDTQMFEAVGSTPAEFQTFMKADRENAGRLIKKYGIPPTDVSQ